MRPESIRVRIFGEAGVEGAGGEPVPLTPQQLALVSLVYGHGAAGVRRPAAARLLWGAEAPTKERQRIRQLLLEVRTRVGAQIIDTPGDVLRPHPDVVSDLTVFDEALSGGSLEAASRLVERGFITAPATAARPFADWRDARAAALRRDVRTRASTRWSVAFEHGDWTTARDAAEALYILDPEDPQAVERVIEARGRVGETTAAEQAFARYLASLPAADSSPLPEIVATMERVRATRRAQVCLTSAEELRVPFVGRRHALATARSSLDTVGRGGFELLLVSGESGIGKTRLLDEIHREAILRDFRCLRAQPVELERSIPLNPLLDALSDVDLDAHLQELGRPWSSVIAGLLPPGTLDHPAEEPPPIQPSSLSRRLLDSFALLFERLARERPTMLFLDDLQWADATTIATLQFMQRRWTQGCLGVFATLRPELVRITDPVAKYLTASAGLQVRQIELPALPTSDAMELIDAIAPGQVTDALAHRLCAIAGHHPLYLTELTRDFLAGRLSLPDRPTDQVSIPTSLARMLDARFEAMDRRAMRVAGVLAVAARPLQMNVIAELAGLSLEDAAGAVDALGRARFIEVEQDRVRMAHELFRSAVYRHMSEARRAIHHRSIAERLLAESPEEFAGELAIHYARAGEEQLAAQYGWAAARRALEAGAVFEAVQFFEVVAEREKDPVKQADATAELARALHLSRDITRANPQLSLAADRLRSTGRPREARRLEIRRLEGLAELAEASVDEVLVGLSALKQEARQDEDWETVALVLDAELHMLHRDGSIAGVANVLAELREIAAKGQLEARLLSKAGLALGVLFDDPKEALRAAEEAIELAANGGYRLRALVRYMVVLQALGRLSAPEFSWVIRDARALAEKSGDVLERFGIESNVAVARLDEGDIEGAEVLMVRANQVSGAGEMDLHRFIRAHNHAELTLARDDFTGARLAFTEAARYLGPTTPTYMQDLVNAGIGYCALETGDLTEARVRERALHPLPPSWYFDPTTLLTFLARMEERRGSWRKGLTLVADAAAELEQRLVLAWLKLTMLQVRIMAKHGEPGAVQLAEAAAERARELGLRHRTEEFVRLATSLR